MDFAFLFIVGFIGAITPGPDILLVINNTLRHGALIGTFTLCGIATGWFVFLSIIYFGLGHIFSGALPQVILSLIGAGYLLYIAYLLLKAKESNVVDSKIIESGVAGVESSAKNGEGGAFTESGVASNLMGGVKGHRFKSKNEKDDNFENLDSMRPKPRTPPSDDSSPCPLTPPERLETHIPTTNSSSRPLPPHTKLDPSPQATESTHAKKLPNQYLRGFIVNISNPKAILFFGVIISPYMSSGNILPSLIVLFFSLGFGFICVIILCAFFRKFINDRIFFIIDKICSVIFTIFAISLLFNAYKILKIL